jgi:hypothetical protein
MGLNALLSRLAMTNPDVSNVSAVQPCDSKAFGIYGSDTANVSGVSGADSLQGVDTADTADICLTYQSKPAWIGACTPDTADTSQIIKAGDVAAAPIADMPAKPLSSFQPETAVDLSSPAKACPDCRHFARPGKSDGYCGGRDDLPLAYGANHPLRRLPANRGASCSRWLERE